ncbi:asparagine synthase-related protein [Butyrivibrio sp. JL13D10]|uniref:asparagine synthase-related protein n=1 Tax=Butyrivibrio sp. JL13D10 TaxID=3236815 RepID=UPI0038B510BA
MSAIWGYIDFEKNSNFEEISRINSILREGYADCKIDRYGDYVADSFCLGCGVQYLVPEAENEVLPIVDEEKGIYFTADAIVDNRDELLPKIGFAAGDNSIPDARILYEMFTRYGEECLNEILGIYTFVYYDKNKNICYIINDALGNRTLQYYYKNGKLYFSTLINPISKATGKIEPNRQWFADFLGLNNFAAVIDCESTPVAGIKRLTIATINTFTIHGSDKKRYWIPEVYDLKLKSDKDYKELFFKTYSEAVNRLVRTDKLTLLLSGGLDSTSIVCMLPYTERGKNVKLRTFTSIPFKNFKSDMRMESTEDESGEVLKTKEFLSRRGFDFDAQFISLDNVDTWSGRIEKEKMLEMPYKPMLNLLWMCRGLSESYEYGSKVMLVGEYGNGTVSLGIGNMYLYDLLNKKKFLRYFQECRDYCRRYDASFYDIVRYIFKVYKLYRLESSKYKEKETATVNPLLSKEAIENYHIQERLDQSLNRLKFNRREFKTFKERIVSETALYIFSEMHTKESLITGAVFRDPTMDKRIIELCCSFPAMAYNKGGISRRLVREYLKEILPDNSRNMNFHGVQSADLYERVKNNKYIFDEIMDIFVKNNDLNLVDIKKAEKEINRIKNSEERIPTFEICRLEYTAMALEMMKNMMR